MEASFSPSDGKAWRTLALSAALCLASGLAARLLDVLGGPPSMSAGLYVGAYLAGGWDAARRASHALRSGSLDIDLLMLVAALGAAAVGAAFEGSVLLFLFSLGNTLESYAFHRTRRSIHGLMALRPETASRIGPEGEQLVGVEELEPGDRVRIRPGERIAVDGRVESGRSHVDESTLTGESAPVGKEQDDEVFAGTLNGDGSLDVVVTRRSHESTLARVIRLVEQARESRAPTQSWLERVQGRYAGAVLLAAAAAVVVPVTFLEWSLSDAFYRAMTLLVVASPCALVISIPATIVSAVSNGARNGVLFKGGASLDALADVRVVALDKTGTVTRGVPRLAGILPLTALRNNPDPETELLRYAAAAESRSEHHLAKAVLLSARERGVALSEPDTFCSFAGRGVSALVDGHEILVGRRDWIETQIGSPVPAEASAWAREEQRLSATPVFVAVDGAHAGVLALSDQPRERVASTLTELRRSGIEHIVMLTGDDADAARVVADQVGIEEVIAEMLPEEKAEAVQTLRARWGPVAMVGDGVNDAPALATADVGVALGAAGTDVALDTADVVIMGDDLSSLVVARELAARARRIVLQNLVLASGVLVTLVALALMGRIGLTVGVIGHEGSTVVVVLNGLRLLRKGRSPRSQPAAIKA